MITVSRRLEVHGVTAEEWTKRWRVEGFTHPCQGCGAPRTTTIPFVLGELRGLIAPPCECGEEFAPFGVVRDWRKGDLLGPGGPFDPPPRRQAAKRRARKGAR